MDSLIIGTRGSALALWQARHVSARLETIQPGLTVTLQIIKTQGDEDSHSAPAQFSDKGIFVKEIEEALLGGAVDLAVHSMKDLPASLPEGLGLIAYPVRADRRDALVTVDGRDLAALPRHARVGTGALRRRAQLARARPDLRFVDMRGNVDTRLRKMAAGEADAVVLAMAGLTRLGLAKDGRCPLDPEVCVPAPGQGVLGLEARLDSAAVRAVVGRLDDASARCEVTAERGVLEVLDAGCLAPIGAMAEYDPAARTVHIRGIVASPDGTAFLESSTEGEAAEAAALGRDVAKQLLAAGAAEILAAARRQAEAGDGHG